MNKEKIILIILLLLGFLIRIINYRYPPLLWDEASLGYNAYSILKTGRDEYGQFLPLVFKSFGDYKPGLYVYLSLPFVFLFGLNELSVRLPSIILGSLLPLLAYLFAKKFSSRAFLPLIFAAIIAFNPYNIHYSRGAWETNILTFELLLASYLFFSKKYSLSSILFGLSLYTYQSGKLISLLLIFALLLVNFNKNFFRPTFLLKFFLPLAICTLPIIFGLLFQYQANRLEVLSLFSYPRSSEEQNTIISEGGILDNFIFHNQYLFFAKNILTRYFNHFSPQFLLTQGDWQNPRHSAPYTGVLLIPSFIFLFIGLFTTFLKNKNSLDRYFLFWLILAPIPAAFTRDIIQATRVMNFSLPLCYFSAMGIDYLFSRFRSPLILSFIGFVYFLSLIYYLDLYFNHMVKKSPQDWLYGYREAITYLIQNKSDRNLTFTTFYGQPYIYYLFYSRYNPLDYQKQAHLDTAGVDTGVVRQIDNIKFDTPNFSSLQLQSNRYLAIFSYDDAVRQGVNLNLLRPLSTINNHSTFYAFQSP